LLWARTIWAHDLLAPERRPPWEGACPACGALDLPTPRLVWANVTRFFDMFAKMQSLPMRRLGLTAL
jgi:hypothetical protein